MSDGFQVDLGAWESAAPGVTETLADLQADRVDSLDGAAAGYGHNHLADTVWGFCDRWKIEIEHLATDGREVAQRLTDSVQVYVAVDKAAKGRMDGIYARATGPDPAAE